MANKNCVNDAELYLVKNSAHMGHIVDIDDKEDNASIQDCDFESHVSEENEDNHQIRDSLVCVKVSLACA